MALLGDVIQILFEQKFLDQVIRNVFGYVVSVADPAATMEDVADRMIIEIGNVYLNVQVPEVAAIQVTVNNLDDVTEFIEKVWTGAGGNAPAGPPLPSYVAGGFKFLRADTDTRNGSKRITGIGEDAVVDNDWTAFDSAGVLAIEDAFAATVFITPTSMEVIPIIIGRDPITGQPDTGRISPVSEVQAKESITTQNSRKAGRGE